MTRRLLVSYVSITLFVIVVLEVPLGVTFARAERTRVTEAVKHDALAFALVAEDTLEGHPADNLVAVLGRYARETGARVVVVDAGGVVVVDSAGRSTAGRNYASRPELAAALRGQEAVITRHSRTLRADLLYVAEPIVSDGHLYGAIRVSYPLSLMDRRIRRTWAVLGGVAAVVLVIVSLVSLRLARSFARPLTELQDAAVRVGRGELGVRAPVPRAPAEIRVLADQFNRTAGHLEELVAAQQAFVADASHELRTPLAALRLRLENLEADRGQDEDLSGAIDEVARLSRLIDGLLALARLDGAEPARTSVDLAAAAAARAEAWAAFAEERGVTIAAEGAPARARCAEGRVDPILDNLLANAIDVSPPGAAVTILTGRDGAWAELRVVDHGPGMTSEERARAFDRFWRSPTARSRAGGSGLGLAIVRRLVTADGGSVELRESSGSGLEALVRLPSTEPREPARQSSGRRQGVRR